VQNSDDWKLACISRFITMCECNPKLVQSVAVDWPGPIIDFGPNVDDRAWGQLQASRVSLIVPHQLQNGELHS
jgi:hypothetical protein